MKLQVQYVGNSGHGIDPEEAQRLIGPVGPKKTGDAGIDLVSCFAGSLHVSPGYSIVVPCGIAVKIPDGHYGQITARSSTYRNMGLLVVNAVIDSGYTGPLFVTVYNPRLDGKQSPVLIEPGIRLAQLIIQPYIAPEVVIVEELPKTERGTTGFGSTGK